MEEKIKVLTEEIESLEKKVKDIQYRINKKKEEKAKLESEFNLSKSFTFDRNWATDIFPWDEQIVKVLKNVFHLNEFRFQQKAAINLILSKKDLMLLMPTGGGKSLCYQLPGIYSPGVTIIVSPLLSLMEDQVIALNKLNISAYAMSSQTSKDDKDAIFKFLNKNIGDIKIIYVTPEWLSKSKRFLSALQVCYSIGKLERFAIGMLID